MNVKRYSMDNVTGRLNIGDSATFVPEPVSRVNQVFKSIMDAGVGALSAASGAVTGGDINPIFAELLQKQMENQIQMQMVSMESNNEKAKHETYMAPVRNLKVG